MAESVELHYASVAVGRPVRGEFTYRETEAFRAKLKALRSYLTEKSEDVGRRFAKEARRIHFGETEHRLIHGQASLDEARALIEDGVDIHPLPPLPDDLN